MRPFDKNYIQRKFDELLFWMDALHDDSRMLNLAMVRKSITQAYDAYMGIFIVLCPPEKKPWKKLREILMLWCFECGCLWWDYGESSCPSCHKKTIEHLLMREVKS